MFCACFRQRERVREQKLVDKWDMVRECVRVRSFHNELNSCRSARWMMKNLFPIKKIIPFLSIYLPSYLISTLHSSTSTPGLSTSEKYIMCCRVRNESWIWMKISVEPLSCGRRPHFFLRVKIIACQWEKRIASIQEWLREGSTNGIIPTAMIQKGKS